mmetsp:Transcript_3256/g.5900  ORF Transcript_3256/g.5900 Transcript_3256/m.5900 type:complete len:121 (+) Transcript_3256:376-738(+)
MNTTAIIDHVSKQNISNNVPQKIDAIEPTRPAKSSRNSGNTRSTLDTRANLARRKLRNTDTGKRSPPNKPTKENTASTITIMKSNTFHLSCQNKHRNTNSRANNSKRNMIRTAHPQVSVQ